MNSTGRRYFKRPHAVIRFLAGVCFVLAFVSVIPSALLLSALLKDPSVSLSSLQAEGSTWVLGLPAIPVACLLLGLGAPRFHRGVFLELEPRTVTVYWGWSLPFGKAWPWWHVGTRSPSAGAPLEVRYLYPGEAIAAYTLVLSGEEAPLVLFSALDYPDTRDLAEQLAPLLELRLRDSTQEAFDVEESEAEEAPGRPAPWTASRREGEARVVYLPSRRPLKPPPQLIVKVLGIAGSVAVLCLLIPWFESGRSNVWVTVPVTLVVLGGLLGHEYASGVSHVLRGSRDGLVVESESIFGRTVRRLSRADVWQIAVVLLGEHTADTRKPKAKRRILSSLLVRGSGLRLVLGAHLPRAELQARARELRAALGLEEDLGP